MNTIGYLKILSRHIEAVARLWQARIELAIFSWRSVLKRVDTHRGSIHGGDDPAEVLRGVERALLRATRLVPGATCIHRAVAARRMLVDRGIAAEVAIGLRKRSGILEGHAWIELQSSMGPIRAFYGDSGDYSTVIEPRWVTVDRFAT